MTTLSPAVVEAASAPLPPARTADNLLDGDAALLDGLRRELDPALEQEVRDFAEPLAEPEWIERGFVANQAPPEHLALDRDGQRADAIRFHPAWHELLRLAVEGGVAGAAWADRRRGALVARAAKFMLVAQVEAGITCPLAMTNSCVPALRLEPALAERWEPLVTSGTYDARELPASRKSGALIGMALTERSGGSDLSGCGTAAEQLDDGSWSLSGSKWFVSAVQSDAFFVIAQTPGGLSCLLVPRLREDGSPNGMRIDRLKDKLGNRSNPTAEVVFEGAEGELVGEEGRGCGRSWR